MKIVKVNSINSIIKAGNTVPAYGRNVIVPGSNFFSGITGPVGPDYDGGRLFTVSGTTLNIRDYNNPTIILSAITNSLFSGAARLKVDKLSSRVFIVTSSKVVILDYTNPSLTPTTISLGGSLGVDREGGRLIIAKSVYDYTTLSLLYTFNNTWVGSPADIAVDYSGKRILLLSVSPARIVVVDYNNPDKTLAVINSTQGGLSFCTRFDFDTENIYVANNGNNMVSFLSYSQPSGGNPVSLNVLGNPAYVSVDNHKIFIGNSPATGLLIIDKPLIKI